jgi:chromate reductase, NAD(P)H dehydrogenase (quinone)
MSTQRKVAVVVGSLRKASFNRKMAHALIALAPPSLAMSIVEIGDLALYNQDLETQSPPAPWQVFRDAIRACDALLFVTPEYNRSIPGVLKNAIDVGSRPYGHNVWNGKPSAVVSVTGGMLGALGANFALREALVAVNAPAMAHPEAYIGGAASLFDDAGNLAKDDTRDFLVKFIAAFEKWVERNTA